MRTSRRGRSQLSQVIVYARPALTRRVNCPPDWTKSYCRSIREKIGARPEEILLVAKIHTEFHSSQVPPSQISTDIFQLIDNYPNNTHAPSSPSWLTSL